MPGRSVRAIALMQMMLVTMARPAFAVAPEAAPTAPPASPPSLQDLFTQASSTAEKGDCAAALPLFVRLAADPRIKPGSLPAGAIAVRRGLCLYVGGQYDDAQNYIMAGLPILRAAGAQFTAETAQAERTLGAIATRRWDRDGAITHLKAALALLDEPDRPVVLMRLAQATAFDGGEQPLAYAREALRIESARPQPDKTTLASIHTVLGRILMNQGRNKEALAELKLALALTGGLTQHVSLRQASLRGDLAEAALLSGEADEARLYLSYTGAGRIEQSPFAVAASMAPPQCGSESGLGPEDVAIVEFGINDDGDANSAQTVYTRGNYAVAAAFARAVDEWYWRPDSLAKIPAFYRVLTRVELRCSNSGGNLPTVLQPLKERFIRWASPLLAGFDLGAVKLGTGMEMLTRLAKQREDEGDLRAAVAALTIRGMVDPRPDAATLAVFDRALSLARTATLPDETIHAILVYRQAARQDLGERDRRWAAGHVAADGAGAGALAEAAAMAQDALAQDTLFLLAGQPTRRRSAGDAAALVRVADDERLPQHHPLRQVAQLQLANLAANAGDRPRAQAYFERTGLSEQQCSLIGVGPAMKSSGASSGDFPLEALRYGFEGWVNLEFDIAADGRTANARAVVAYPPFVFVKAATGVARDMRYETSYRPSGAAACSANRQTVKFLIPHH